MQRQICKVVNKFVRLPYLDLFHMKQAKTHLSETQQVSHLLQNEPNRVDRIASGIPLKRGGRPAEIAEAIVWLASAQASYVTGAILDVTGGI